MPFAAVYTPEPTRPSTGAEAGTQILYDAIDDDLFSTTVGLGIFNPRDVCGNQWTGPGSWPCIGSQHAAGRAGDHGVSLSAAGRALGERLATWLVTNYRALGIQEVIFYDRRWDNQTKLWRKYTGRDNHHLHVHWAQNATAAALLTRAQVDAVAPQSPPPPIPPPAPPILEAEMSSIVQGNASVKVYVSNGINRRHVKDQDEENQLVISRQAARNGAEPFVIEQAVLDRIPIVT